MNLYAILPEIILTAGALVLMMVAAFGGRRVTALTSWASVALLVGACFALVGDPQTAGPMFGGLIVADGFGAFGKLVAFLSSAVAIIAALGWFERDFEHGAEYPVLILLAAVGMAVMVSATSLMTLYVGLGNSSSAESLSIRWASDRVSTLDSLEAGKTYVVKEGVGVIP